MRELREALDWAIERLGLRDWAITLDCEPRLPTWAEGAEFDASDYGVCRPCVAAKHAKIWINPSPTKTPGFGNAVTPVEIVFHELIHVLIADIGGVDFDKSGQCEHAWTRMALIMVDAYKAKK